MCLLLLMRKKEGNLALVCQEGEKDEGKDKSHRELVFFLCENT